MNEIKEMDGDVNSSWLPYGLTEYSDRRPPWDTPNSVDSGLWSCSSGSELTPHARRFSTPENCSASSGVDDSGMYIDTPKLKQGRWNRSSKPSPSAIISRDISEKLVFGEAEAGLYQPRLSPIKEAGGQLQRTKRPSPRTTVACSAKKVKVTLPKESPVKKQPSNVEMSPFKVNADHMFGWPAAMSNRSGKPAAFTLRLPQPSCLFTDDGKVDFLRRLSKELYAPQIITKILGYLTPRDLRTVCMVSTTWQRVCTGDKTARALLHMHKQKISKFGIFKNKENVGATPRRPLVDTLQRANEMTPTKKGKSVAVPASPPVSPGHYWFHVYTKEAQKLDKRKKLLPCPTCHHPSHVNEQSQTGQCVRVTCSFVFCTRCRAKTHPGASCRFVVINSPTSSPEATPRRPLWSKETRKALRRL